MEKREGVDKGDYKECIEPSSFTVTFLLVLKGVAYHRGRGTMGDIKEEHIKEEEVGWEDKGCQNERGKWIL